MVIIKYLFGKNVERYWRLKWEGHFKLSKYQIQTKKVILLCISLVNKFIKTEIKYLNIVQDNYKFKQKIK